MAATISAQPVRCQAEGGSPAAIRQGESVTLHALLRAAIDDRKWKHDAIAVALKVPPKYFSRMLSGEKAITAKHLRALPDDVEIELLVKWAESLGVIVIVPVSDTEARRQLATGLFCLLSGRSELPARTTGPIKAALHGEKKVGIA